MEKQDVSRFKSIQYTDLYTNFLINKGLINPIKQEKPLLLV